MSSPIGGTVDAEGVAVLTWDLPGATMNVLDAAALEALGERVDEVLADPRVRGVVLTSGKPDFVAGADLGWIRAAAAASPEALLETNLRLKATLRKIELGRKPFVAALTGTTLGAGYEIALACHRRLVAADRPDAQIGLPEVKLGLIPGGGGTQRLPRLIGVREALPLLTQGTTLDPARARASGLVDAVVPADQLIAAARAWILEGGAAVQPWDAPGYRIPGGEIQSPRGYETFIGANALLRKETFGNYPAPQAILACVYHGLQLPLEPALAYEARRFVEIVRGPVAQSMVRTLFFHVKDANALKRRPEGVPKARFTKVGVLGAGMMGAGIAYQCASRGLEVVLIDATPAQAERGRGYGARLLEERVRKGRATASEAEATLARVLATTDYERLAGAELVIEAVFEDRSVKADVTRRAEAVVGPEALLASNTSTLPIGGLAEAVADRTRFIGLHFFSPVEKMPLLEIIAAETTSPATIARALDFARRVGKTPIVVGDRRGFFTSRVFATYLNEGMTLLAEGVPAALIENAGRLAGMPVGPLALADEVSLELVDRIAAQTARDLGAAYVASPSEPIVRRLVELGRVGKRAGAGFYAYPSDAPKHTWPGLRELFPPSGSLPSAAAIGERLLDIQALEAVRALEEGVVRHPEDADVGSVLGWGFCPFHGGVLSYIDAIGAPALLARAERFERALGPRFRPPERLRAMAAQGSRFHPA